VVADEEIRRALEDLGLEVDEGNRVGGPFIPDGTTRIYDEDTLDVLAEGPDLQEAYKTYAMQHGEIL
jgi:hypothetical protein